jgi:hypothetical protein
LSIITISLVGLAGRRAGLMAPVVRDDMTA